MLLDKHTFVIPAYKESPFLETCIQNLLAQTVKSNIVITTSTPNNYILDLANKYNLPYYINEGNTKGIAADWNFALSKSITALTTIAHQDDIYLPNFTNIEVSTQKETVLKGLNGKRILCLANLRDQKNHFLLLEVAEKLKKTKPDWTFHLVGKDFEDNYSAKIKGLIQRKKLGNTVFVYGSKNDVNNIINQADIAILTSKSEGLPVALIEYGLMSKPVILTNVGEIPFIIQDDINGFIVGVNEVEMFYERLIQLIDDSTLRLRFGNYLHQTILENHSEEGVIIKYLNWIETL